MAVPIKNLTFYCVLVLLTITGAYSDSSSVKNGNKGRPALPAIKTKVTTPKGWIFSALERHNYLRSLHGSQPLALNETLCEISQAWANYLLSRTQDNFINSTKGEIFFEHSNHLKKLGIGENLFFTTHLKNLPVNGSVAPTLWYEEIKDYDFEFARVKGTSKPDSMIGHFTQLIWNNTNQMGTAYATGPFRSSYPDELITFVVAHYYPVGNILLRSNFPEKFYLKNVFPPLKQSENEIEDKKNIDDEIQRKIKYWEIPTDEVTTPSSWREKAVCKQNEYRRWYDTSPLAENALMSSVAQAWANILVNKSIPVFNSKGAIDMGRYNGFTNFGAVVKAKFGESIAYYITQKPTDVDAEPVISMWFNQHEFYDFNLMTTNRNKSRTAKTADFEQLMWRSTKRVGIAYSSKKAENGQFITFVVAYYYPKAESGTGGTPIEQKRANLPESSASVSLTVRNLGEILVVGLIYTSVVLIA